MDLRSAWSWIPLILTLCALILQTDCISSQCTERPLGPTVTELCHEKIPTSTVKFSCRSHSGVTIVARNGSDVEPSKIKFNNTGNCLRLMEATRPAGCSVLSVGFEKETIDCTILDHAFGLSNTPSTVTPTTNLPEGDGNKPFLKLIILCSCLLCAGFVLCFVFCEAVKRWLSRIIGCFLKNMKKGKYDQVPDGNNENPDDLEMQSSV